MRIIYLFSAKSMIFVELFTKIKYNIGNIDKSVIKMNENSEMLLYIYKNVDMGAKSTTKLLKLLNNSDNKIKPVIEKELKGYESFLKKTKSLLKKYKIENI